MNLDYEQEVLRQIVFVSSILSGFAFSIIIQLIVGGEKKKAVSWTLGSFIMSASIFLITTCIGAILLFALIILKWQPSQGGSDRISTILGLIWLFFTVGLWIFMVGVGTAGWIYSKVMGIVATISAIVSLLIILGLFYCICMIFIS